MPFNWSRPGKAQASQAESEQATPALGHSPDSNLDAEITDSSGIKIVGNCTDVLASMIVEAVPGSNVGDPWIVDRLHDRAKYQMTVPRALDDEVGERGLYDGFIRALEVACNEGYASVCFWSLDQRYTFPDAWYLIAKGAVSDFMRDNPQSQLKVFVADRELFERDQQRLEAQLSDPDSPSLDPTDNAANSREISHTSVDVTPPARDGLDSGAAEAKSSPLPERADDTPATDVETSGDAYQKPDTTEQPVEWVQGKTSHGAHRLTDRYLIGEPKGTFTQTPFAAKQPAKNQYRADLAADIAQVGQLRVLGASFRGALHYGTRTIRQDSFAIGTVESERGSSWVIAAVADGVSEAEYSHQLADYLAQQTVLLVKGELATAGENPLAEIDWTSVSRNLLALSQTFCKRLAQGKITRQQWLSRWASTLEFVVVQADRAAEVSFASITVAGDGAVYIVNRANGWRTVKSGKPKTGDIASNAVTALPVDPGEPVICHGSLEPGELLLVTTDGLSDMIGDGGSELGGFFQEHLPQCANLISYLQVVDVSMFQADDDRTAVSIQVNQS